MNPSGPDVIWDRAFLKFLLPVAVLAGLSASLRLGDVIRIAIFGVLVFLWSLVYPRRWAPLPPAKVDFWCYLLAGVGIVMLFIDSGVQRERVNASLRRSTAAANLQVFLARRAEVERIIVGSPRETFASLQEAAAKSLESVRARQAEAVAACEQQQVEFLKRLDEERRLEQTRRMRQAQRPGEVMPPLNGPIRPFPIPDCTAVASKAATLTAAVARLRDAKHPSELVALLKDASPKDVSPHDLQQALGLNLGSIGLDALSQYLVDAWHDQSVAPVLDREEAQWRGAYRDANDMLIKLESPGELSTRDVSVITVVLQFVWPYILLSALGLQLASKSYLFGKE